MLNLIVKDVLVQRKQLAFSFFYILFMTFVFQKNEIGTFLAAISAFTYLLVSYSCANEDKNKSDVMINSLPVKRSQVVAMKYLSVIVFFLAGTVAYMLFTSILKNTGINIKIYTLTIDGIIGGFISVSLLTGIYFPVYFKVGYMKSRILSIILFFGTFTGISYLANYIQRINSNILDKLLSNFLNSQGNTVIMIILFAIAVIFQIVSYGVSVKIYNNREL